MSEFRPVLRSALHARSPLCTAGISLTAQPEGHVVHVLARPGADMTPVLVGIAPDPFAVRAAAPGQWFIVGDAALTDEALQALRARLAPMADGVDVSHGRTRIRISGPMVARTLAKGTGADLALAAFPVGHATTTLFGHIATHVTRIAEDAFELMVLRSFAESLWDDLAQMSAEFDHSAAGTAARRRAE